MAGLTNKQKVFVEEYLQCWNATEAARRAGYKNPGRSGPENVSKRGIQEKVAERLAAKAMDADEVLARLGDQARGDLGDFLDITPGGVAVNLGKAKSKTHLIKKFRQSGDGGIWIELYDSQAALEKLGRHAGLFVSKVDVTSKGKRVGGDLTDLSDEELDALYNSLIAVEEAERVVHSGEEGTAEAGGEAGH